MKEITSICCCKDELIEHLSYATQVAILDGHKDIQINIELDLPDKDAANIWLWDISDEN